MADTLKVFGTTYSNVAGFKASDGNNGTLTYIRPQGNLAITANNNSIDVAQYATVSVNVSGSGGIGTLLTTYTIGAYSTSATSATDMAKSFTVSGYNNYDALLVETSVDTQTNGRHTATAAWIFLTASSAQTTKNGSSIATTKWNSKRSSTGTTTTRAGTTAYGIYPYSCTISNSTCTIALYSRYNSTSTGTINGNYTTRVYGIKLYDLIGG